LMMNWVKVVRASTICLFRHSAHNHRRPVHHRHERTRHEADSKRQLIPTLLNCVPSRIGRYIETSSHSLGQRLYFWHRGWLELVIT
jgi:hypothetical protein